MGTRAVSWIMRTPLVVSVLSAALTGTVVAQPPQGVSPGAIDRSIEVEARCPTFSWTFVPDAEGYELVAYRLPEGMVPANLDLSYAKEVMFTRLTGAATSWTPDVVHCLAPGGQYVWFARTVFGEELQETPVTNEWSQGRFFSVSAVPTASEVEEAMEVLRRYVASGGGRDAGAAVTASTQATDLAERRDGAVGRRPLLEGGKSVTTAKTAIKGHVSGSSGPTYGLVGISDSAAGAGVAAANTNGGPDLVLDGSEDLLPDTLLTQSGIDRPWGTSQTFNIRNSAGGGMTLQVDGQTVGMISQIEAGSGLTGGGSAGTVSIAIGTGAVTAAHLGTNSVGAAEISTGAVGQDEIAQGAVTSDEILNGTITYQDTNVDSVQRRVTGGCASSRAIKSISNDGSVVCEFDDFNQMELSPEYSAESFNGNDAYAIINDNGRTVCFLTRVGVRDVDGSDEDAICRVYLDTAPNPDQWILIADTETGDDADARCTMRCLSWGTRAD